MASSKMMMNMSSRNSDLIRRKSSSNSSSSTNSSTANHNHNHKQPPVPAIRNNSGVFQMTVDGLVNNDNQQSQPQPQPQQTTARTSSSISNGQKSVDDVWKEIVAAGGRTTSCCKQEVPDHHEMMTLEDFLAKAGAVEQQQDEEEEDVKIPSLPLPLPIPSDERLLSGGIFNFDNSSIHPPPNPNVDDVVGFGGIGVDDIGGRGKRRAILEPLDKAAQQRQRRMIKNRESAARSRERKQAYQAELESLAVKLEEENDTLLKAKEEQTRKRYKQLMDNIIPVTEKPRPTRYVLRKVRSMEW